MSANGDPLPVEIPLFPLPNVVLFPSAVVPLHIFEPRYRTMVQDCMDGDGVFGMVLMRRTPEDPTAVPPLYPVGAAGRIVSHHPLEDGRSYILVKGLQRFRIGDLGHDRPYLTARVAYLSAPDLPAGRDADLRRQLTGAFERYLTCCTGDTEQALARVRKAASAAEAADFIAACMDLPAPQRQALLEVLDPAERAGALLDEMREVTGQAAVTQATRRAGWPPPDFSPN